MVGHETTSNALNLILWELARNPLIQERLRDEIVSCGAQLDYAQLTNPSSLPILDAVVKEGYVCISQSQVLSIETSHYCRLRLHPPPCYAERTAIRDDVIPLSKPLLTRTGEEIRELRVPAGQVSLSLYLSSSFSLTERHVSLHCRLF